MITRKTDRHHTTTVKLADLYGEAAYQAYLAREQQIKKMSYDTKNWPPLKIAHLHEQNWTLLKQKTPQAQFSINFYGNMVPVDKLAHAQGINLRSAV